MAMTAGAATPHLTEGASQSAVRVIVYEDLQCTDCATFRKMLDDRILPKYAATVAFEHRDFPLTKHPWARKAAIAARYFGQQSPDLDIAFRRFAMSHQSEITVDNFEAWLARFANDHHLDPAKALAGLNNKALAEAVESDYREGVARGIAKTPTALVNGQPFIETFTFEEISKTLDSELAATRGQMSTQQSTAGSNKPMFKDDFAEVNGVRLHYVSAGQGPLIIFLHGFPEFWYEWKNQLAEFGKDYLAVAPDMRGYNLSGKPEDVDQYQVKYLIEDVRALAEHVGHKKFILVAHDWGGAVAWAYAIAHPETLEKLVIVNAPHPGVFARELAKNPLQQKASQYMLMFRDPKAEETLSANNYAALVNIVLGAGLKSGANTEEDKQAYLNAWSQPGALTGGLNYYRASRIGPPPDAADAAGSTPSSGNFAADPSKLTVKVPTLVIWGEKDTALLTGNLEGLDEYVPRLTIKRIPEGSHWVIHEKPAEVNGYIREFISRP